MCVCICIYNIYICTYVYVRVLQSSVPILGAARCLPRGMQRV